MKLREILGWLFCVGVLFVTGCTSASNNEEISDVSFEVVPTINVGSLISTKANYVVKSMDEWEEITGLTTVSPTINFDEKMLIISNYGSQATGGYLVEIEKIQFSNINGLSVDVKFTVPGPSCGVTLAFTVPKQVVKLDRITGITTFSETTVINNCVRFDDGGL